MSALSAPAPYYRLQLVGGEPGGRRYEFTTYYVPWAKAVAWVEDGFVRLHPIHGPRANGVMRGLTGGLQPDPAPRITTAIVDADDIVAGRVLHDESDRRLPWEWLALAGVGMLAAVSLVHILPFKS